VRGYTDLIGARDAEEGVLVISAPTSHGVTSRDISTEGVHTPTGPRRDLWDSPELWITLSE